MQILHRVKSGKNYARLTNLSRHSLAAVLNQTYQMKRLPVKKKDDYSHPLALHQSMEPVDDHFTISVYLSGTLKIPNFQPIWGERYFYIHQGISFKDLSNKQLIVIYP
jgi:hypothetical protein